MARKRRKTINGPRTKAILIRVNNDEQQLFRQAAQQHGTTISLAAIDAIRLMLDQTNNEDEEKNSPIVDELKSIRYELRRIGVNVNQIAHWANREMILTDQEHDATINAIIQCRQLITQATTIINNAQHDKL